MNNDGILTEGRRTAVLVFLAASLVIVVLATLAEVWLAAIASAMTAISMGLALRKDRAARLRSVP